MQREVLQLSDDGCGVYINAKSRPDEASPLIDRAAISTWMLTHQVANYFRFDDVINDAIAMINAVDEQKSKTDNLLLIAEKRDAVAIGRIDNDGMKGYIQAEFTYGGAPLSGASLLKVMKEANINRGIRKKALQKLLVESHQLKYGEMVEVCVAIGMEPIPGEDAKLLYFVQDSKSRVLKPQLRADGTVDMRDLGTLIMVKEGQVLAKRLPPTEGTVGFNIRGEVLPTEKGQECSVQLYPGSRFSDHDPDILLSERAGTPVLHKDGVEVENALNLDGVNVSTGHIHFEGSVVINGDIESAMRVEATGSITVGGVVESATLIAGGDVVVQSGILGRQQQDDRNPFSTVIKAKGSIVAKFAQYAKLNAGEHIHLTLHCMHCQTKAGGHIAVYDDQFKNGTLTGGFHIARHGMKVVSLGAASGVHTYVHVFTGLTGLMQEFRTVKQQLQKEFEQLAKIEDAQSKLLSRPPEKLPTELLERISWTKKHHLERVSILQKQMQAEGSQLSGLYKTYVIEAVKVCYNNVHCKIGDCGLTVSSAHSACRLVNNGKEIQIEPLT